jgi:predicted ribosome quality control (RQC) complex YloA/Tae2 family protein
LGKSREEKMRIHVNPISNDNVIYSHNSEFSASSIAEKLIEELEKDPKIRKRLAELMVTDSDIKLAIINAVLADVATKSDLEELEERLRNDFRNEIQREVRRLEDRISALEDRIAAFENRVNSIEERLTRLEGQMDLFVKLFIAFNLPTLIAVIGILLKMVFS